MFCTFAEENNKKWLHRTERRKRVCEYFCDKLVSIVFLMTARGAVVVLKDRQGGGLHFPYPFTSWHPPRSLHIQTMD
jgi:hypothetical protein